MGRKDRICFEFDPLNNIAQVNVLSLANHEVIFIIKVVFDLRSWVQETICVHDALVVRWGYEILQFHLFIFSAKNFKTTK